MNLNIFQTIPGGRHHRYGQNRTRVKSSSVRTLFCNVRVLSEPFFPIQMRNIKDYKHLGSYCHA